MSIDKEIIKNAHCKYFEGQTGQCQAKEFIRCNPINCKLYTIDELSTILDLQKQLQRKEQDAIQQSKLCSEYRKEVINLREQLERKEQKLKHLQEDYTELEQRHNESYQEFIRLKQECEELKEKYNEYVKTHHYNNAEFKQERDSLIQEIQYNNRYKRVLEKIEEMVKSDIQECINYDDCYRARKQMELYLDIINEVKE